LFDVNFSGVLNKFPVMFTEFGCNVPGEDQYTHVNNPGGDDPICSGGEIKPDALDYYKTVIGWVNTYGFHYTGWGWWVDHCKPWWPCLCLIKNLAGEPINGGVVVQEDLLNNGVDRFWHWHPVDST
jgi:hypothetical protein